MSPKPLDERELRALFEEIEAPASVGRWREPTVEPAATGSEIGSGGQVVTPLPERWLRQPPKPRMRSMAVVAAGIAVVVGLGGVVIANQLLTDDPPANPPMIIDGPDRPTSTDRQPSSTAPTDRPPATSDRPPASGAKPGSGGNDGADTPDGQQPPNPNGGPRGEAEPPPMVGFPSPTNAGVPLDTAMTDHEGDLHVTTPGTMVSNLRVNGAVVVDAPNVTLRRVQVYGRNGTAVRQTSRASGLTIELSDLTGTVVQEAGGLTLRRCVTDSIAATSGTTVVDTYFGSLQAAAGATRLVLRHNTVTTITLNDLDGPITDVTIEDGDLGTVAAPSEPWSRDIRVRRNVFRSDSPSTGWNAQAPGYEWTGNTSRATGGPVGP
ncbi:MAG: hypothetical protein GEV28_02430 [Actinophytocola sp.]|uniref:hypothetical protein n=1 Tax=Actinophytocola sp. TaxID=1872138 RepID=UPI001320EA74|nr:hypothetical protein [Actinophytocola sp.]MPZ79296.1 hypothetical protein [Actinophytocola sp.]